MRIWILSAALLMLAACSTAPVSEETAKRIPGKRVYAPELLVEAPAPGDAEVVFLRDGGFAGAGCSYDIYVNDVKAFSMDAGEIARLGLQPGLYFFRLESGGGLCPNIAISQDIELAAGDSRAYRILLPSDMSLRLSRIR